MTARNPWQLYDNLVDLIPSDLTVTDALINRVALISHSAGGVGTASADHGGQHTRPSLGSVKNTPLKDIAAWVKSWDFERASLGVAALNSWFNSKEHLAELGSTPSIDLDESDRDIFDARAAALTGKKVALIGHFTQGIAALSEYAELTVLERDPRDHDLPDPACEYVLPSMDAVFLTGMTVANKTLPRLLELTAGAEVFLVGPSVPCAPEVFTGLAQHIAGSYITDGAAAYALASMGARTPQIRPAAHRFTLSF